MALPENRVGKAVLPDSGSSPKNPQHHLPCRVCSEFTTTFSPRSSQCSVATPQLLSPSGIGSRFPAQAVQLFSFDRNLRSIVAVGSTRLESPWLRARWKVGGFDLSSIRSRPRFCGSNSGPTKEKAVTYQTWQRQIFRGEDQSDDHLHTAGSFVPAVSGFILFLKGRIAPPSARGEAGLMRVPAFSCLPI